MQTSCVIQMNSEKRIYDLKSQIMTTSWDLPLIKNEKIKQFKLQKLEQLKYELNALTRR